MNIKYTINIIGFTLITSCLVHASEVPTIDFSGKTKQELNKMAVEQDLTLTPRSKKSLKARMTELGISEDSSDYINAFLASQGERAILLSTAMKFVAARKSYQRHGQLPPDTPASDGQQPGFSVIVIEIPAAAQPGYGPHGLGCPCPWPDAAAPSQKNGGSWWRGCSLQ